MGTEHQDSVTSLIYAHMLIEWREKLCILMIRLALTKIAFVVFSCFFVGAIIVLSLFKTYQLPFVSKCGLAIALFPQALYAFKVQNLAAVWMQFPSTTCSLAAKGW